MSVSHCRLVYGVEPFNAIFHAAVDARNAMVGRCRFTLANPR
jgi:hypothetical protein